MENMSNDFKIFPLLLRKYSMKEIKKVKKINIF